MSLAVVAGMKKPNDNNFNCRNLRCSSRQNILIILDSYDTVVDTVVDTVADTLWPVSVKVVAIRKNRQESEIPRKITVFVFMFQNVFVFSDKEQTVRD